MHNEQTYWVLLILLCYHLGSQMVNSEQLFTRSKTHIIIASPFSLHTEYTARNNVYVNVYYLFLPDNLSCGHAHNLEIVIKSCGMLPSLTLNLQHSPSTQLLAPLGQEVQAPPTA